MDSISITSPAGSSPVSFPCNTSTGSPDSETFAGSGERCSVLVASDNPAMQKSTADLMTDWGYDVTAIRNGSQAMELLEQEGGPDLAIVDRSTDGASGVDICRRIRTVVQSRFIYIILITRDVLEDRIEGLSGGADDCLNSPFDALELKARLAAGRRICQQRSLRDNALALHEAVECSGVGTALLDADANWIQVNQALLDFFGYQEAELRTHTVLELTHPDDIVPSRELLEKLLAGELKTFQLEERYFHKSGQVIWGLITVTSVESSCGSRARAITQLQDITKRKVVQQALHESESLFRAIAENANELIAVTDHRGTILYTNPAYQKDLGYAAEELNGQNILGHVHPDDQALVYLRTQQAMQSGENNIVQVRLRHKDGSWKTVDARGGIIRDAKGKVERLVATSRIIDDWIAAQDVLREREEQLQLILDSTAEAIYGLDRAGNCTFCNNAFLRLLGYESPHQILGKNVHLLVHHSHADGTHYPSTECLIYQALTRGETVHVEDEVLWRADETSFPVEYRSYPVRKDGQTLGAVVTFIDITNRKRDEARLREANIQSELVINSVPSILIGLDARGQITQWNRAASDAFELTADNVRGKPICDCGIIWLHADMEKQVKGWVASTTSHRVDNIMFQKDGETRLLGLTVTPVDLSNKSSSAVLIIGADTTERKVLEEQLRQAQKLEAIGQLAAGIAHEINTPIQFVGDNTTFIKDSWEAIGELIEESRKLHDEALMGTIGQEKLDRFEQMWTRSDFDYLQKEVPRAVDQSLEGIKRVANIVKAMKEFSHPGSQDKKAIDMNHAIETTITVARNEWRYVADVSTVFSPDLPMVPCLLGEFNQAVLNLIINAAHAIADVVGDGSNRRGLITVSTRRDGDWAEVSVQDTGAGIPDSIKSRIYEPFFTTKDVGKGTGQGLAQVYAVVVKKHGGKIWFTSKVGEGTTFFLALPLAKRDSASGGAIEESGALHPNQMTGPHGAEETKNV